MSRKSNIDRVNNAMTNKDKIALRNSMNLEILKNALRNTRSYKGSVSPLARRLGFTDEMANMSLKEFYEYEREQERKERDKGGADNE